MTSRYVHHPHIQTRIPSASSASIPSTSIPVPTAANSTLPALSNTTGQHASTSTASTVRRNLFHHHLSRRPASATSSSSASVSTIIAGGSSGRGSQNNGSGLPAGGLSRSTSTSSTTATLTGFDNGNDVDSGDIVARDKHGNYKLDIPLPPVMPDEDGDEADMEGIEENRHNGGSGNIGGTRQENELVGGDQDTELIKFWRKEIEASLMEFMRRNRGRQPSNEPAEILHLIHQSLQNKVAALDDDNWMYEAEDEIRV